MSGRSISPQFDNLDSPECRGRWTEVPPRPPIHGSPLASRRVVPRLPLPIRPESRRISRSQFALNPTEDLSNNWKSPLSLVTSKYAFGSRVMSSNDSLNMEHNQHSHDTSDQRVYGSVLASPAVSRRDFGPPQPAYAMPSQAPQPGKMLVDPQTGQHYFVPTAPQPHVAYYPVFYNAPPQSSQPVYYPHHPPAGYMMSAPPMPSPTVQNQPYYFPPTYNQQGSMGNFSQSFGHPPSSSQGYRVEVPPSSSVSICGERESPTQYFQRHHESRLSTESTNSSNSRHYVQNYVDGAKTDDSMSPVPQKSQHHNITPPTASSNHAMDNSARYSTTSSSTTSGFVSQAGEGPSEHARPNNLRTAFQKPQLYGSPSWWGEESSPEGNKQDERTPTRASNSRQNSRSDEKLQSPTTSTHSEVKASQKTESVAAPCSQEADPKPVMKSIRMDIDLSRPFSPEEKEKINVKAAAAVQSTAFTVNFDDSNEKPKRPKPPVLSSQEQQKRQFRRSIPPSKPSLPAAAGNDTKHYLFSKMIQGFPKGEESATTAMMALSIKSETDTLSEAGTYVIENKDTKANRRQRKYSSSSSSSADSTETDGSSSRPTYSQPSSTRMYTPRTETATSSTVSSGRSSDHQKPSQPFPMKRHLMKDLRDLRTQNQQSQQPPSPRTSLPAPKVRSMVDQSKNSRLNPPSPVKVCQQQQTTSRAGISNSSAGFRSARCHSET
uniref:Selenocysteine insertion sequence-binding protein 2-like n=1 Tax=Bursaphelenchus xylophilus TaxID=6326 RepID=A0A1I7RT39_BURXY